MSYLDLLKKNKTETDKYNLEAEFLKQAIFDINSLYSVHDGEFLEDLLNLIKKWKNKK